MQQDEHLTNLSGGFVPLLFIAAKMQIRINKYLAVVVCLLYWSSAGYAQNIDDIQSVTVLSDKNSVNISPVDMSQCKILDTAQLIVTYRLYSRVGQKDQLKYIDDIVLLIGRNFTQSSPATYIKIDSLYSVHKRSLQAPMIINMEVTRNILMDSISVYNRLPYISGICLSYDECLPKLDWQISQETEDILGYRCHIATTNFGGRDWKVCFTTGLPFSAGPYKLAALPGLILSASTIDGDYSFTCASISTDKSALIIHRDTVSKKISRQKFSDMITEFCKTPLSHLGGEPHKLHIFYVGNKRLDDFWNIDYNPIELE